MVVGWHSRLSAVGLQAQVKLADFGVCFRVMSKEGGGGTWAGTPHYLPLRIVRQERSPDLTMEPLICNHFFIGNQIVFCQSIFWHGAIKVHCNQGHLWQCLRYLWDGGAEIDGWGRPGGRPGSTSERGDGLEAFWRRSGKSVWPAPAGWGWGNWFHQRCHRTSRRCLQQRHCWTKAFGFWYLFFQNVSVDVDPLTSKQKTDLVIITSKKKQQKTSEFLCLPRLLLCFLFWMHRTAQEPSNRAERLAKKPGCKDDPELKALANQHRRKRTKQMKKNNQPKIALAPHCFIPL